MASFPFTSPEVWRAPRLRDFQHSFLDFSIECLRCNVFLGDGGVQAFAVLKSILCRILSEFSDSKSSCFPSMVEFPMNQNIPFGRVLRDLDL